MLLTRLTDGDSEAISLTEVKQHLRIDETDDHDALLLFITAVRQATEQYLERTLINSQWQYEIDSFPSDGMICLPFGPVTSIDSVQYYDDDDVQQTVTATDYEFGRDGRLRPTSTKVWPSTYDRLNAITITYWAGETHAGNVPEDIRHAMRLMVGNYDQNREDTAYTQVFSIPHGFKHLLNAHRVHRL